MPNKTEVKGLHAPELREALSNHFEGITEDTTKDEMTALVDDHWHDWLEEAMNPPEESESDSSDEELADQGDWSKDREAFLRKDLYTGTPPA